MAETKKSEQGAKPQAQFTPGPWVVDEDYEDEEQQAIGIVKEGRGYIAGIHILASCNNGEGFTAEDRANAALIAAAPAMYEALQQSLVLVELAALEEWGRAVRGEQQPPTTEAKDRLEKVKAALAQAEGRQA